MTESSTYVHIPLSAPRHIRVIELGPVSLSSELRCRLKEVSLDETPFPQYAALSYCWGSPTLDHSIQCSDKNLHITTNCYAALMKVRKAKETTILWVDSICIDQTSISERNKQVELMGEVYKKADKVIVWLGEWDSTIRKAVDTIKDIGSPPLFEGEMNVQKGLLVQRQMHAKVDILKQAVRTSSDDPVGPLFQMPWFSRMWTVQEVSLARGDNVIFYGGEEPENTLSWPTLIAAIDALLYRRYEWGNISKAVKLQKHLTIMLLMKRYPQLKAIHDAKPGDIHSNPVLWQILLDAREKDATDLKDKVYGLYGILQELEVPIPSPDYGKSLEDIYREFTIACVNADKLLYVLFDVPSDNRHLHPNLLSWVPDWSDYGWRRSMTFDSRVAVTRDRFHAAGYAKPYWSFLDNGNHMQLSAKLLDTVVFCADPLFIQMDGDLYSTLRNLSLIAQSGGPVNSEQHQKLTTIVSQTYKVLKSWVDISQWYEKYPTGESTKDALCRILLQDAPNARDVHPMYDSWYNFMSQTEDEVLKAHLRQQLGNQTPPGGLTETQWYDQIITRLPPGTLGARALQPPHGAYHSGAMTYSNRKTFFTTENGYMGTAAAIIKDNQAESLIRAGDRIAVVAGLEMPMILRPVNENTDDGVFRLVTHAYVHGIMYGEKWESSDNVLRNIILE